MMYWGVDASFVEPEANTIVGALFKKKNKSTKLWIQNYIWKWIFISNEKRDHNKLKILKIWQIPQTSQNPEKYNNTFINELPDTPL
jgi:hypothetical protein